MVLILRQENTCLVVRLQVYPIYTYVYMCVDLALYVLASKPQRILSTNTSKYCKQQYLCHTTFVTCCTVSDSCYGRPETRHSRLRHLGGSLIVMYCDVHIRVSLLANALLFGKFKLITLLQQTREISGRHVCMLLTV